MDHQGVIPWGLTLASVVLVSLVSLVGVATLSLHERRVRQFATVLVSFAVGALLGDAFIHLIPAAFARAPSTLAPSLLVLAGVLLFFVLEKLLRHRHGPLHRQHHPDDLSRPEIAVVNIVGDAVHNFVDGALIGASYLVSPELGLSTTVAVLLHEVPQELGDFGILVHSGLGVKKAVLVNLASASTAIVGAVVALLIGGADVVVTAALVPLTAGGFVYIAAADLIPELQHDRSLRGLAAQVALISLGVLLMALLAIVE